MSWVSGLTEMQRRGYEYLEQLPTYIVGVDLGQARDFTAVCVAVKNPGALPKPTFDVNHLERFRNVPYPTIVEHVATLLRHIDGIRPRPKIELVIDATGVGAAVADLFREADLPGNFSAVLIHGGDAVSNEGDVWRVPKRLLAGTVQVMLQTRRLGISEALTLRPVLVDELGNFKAKINHRGHDSYGAGDDWRENNHDDLVLAVALALWKGENETQGWGVIDPHTIAVLERIGL